MSDVFQHILFFRKYELFTLNAEWRKRERNLQMKIQATLQLNEENWVYTVRIYRKNLHFNRPRFY